MNHSFDFTDQDEERLTGMLHELGSSWFFGWGQGMVQGLPDGNLFEELPRRWKSGIVHPVGPDVRCKVPDYKAMYESLHQLQKLQDEVNEREIVYSKCLFYLTVNCEIVNSFNHARSSFGQRKIEERFTEPLKFYAKKSCKLENGANFLYQKNVIGFGLVNTIRRFCLSVCPSSAVKLFHIPLI